MMMQRTTLSTLTLLFLGLAIGGSAPGLSSSGDGDESWKAESTIYRLKHSAHKKWAFVLPAERWHDAGKSIELPGGLVFDTKIDGVNKLMVDSNGDGRPNATVRGSGFITLGAKDETGESVRYSVRVKNTAAGKFEWTTGSSMRGMVAGTILHVFDQDGNGKYSDWGVDAVAVGNSKSASLLSKVILVGKDLYHFDVTEDGSQVTVAPFSGETGILNAVVDYEAKGILTSAVFQSGDISFCVAPFKKGVAVPVGTYKFVSGRVEKGSASVSMRGGKMPTLQVYAGEETVPEWGANVNGDFSFSQKDEDVTVKANFKFFGAAGEEYYDFQPAGKGPKIIISDAKRGREIKEARFPES